MSCASAYIFIEAYGGHVIGIFMHFDEGRESEVINLFLDDEAYYYRHQPSQSRVDIEHWLKANTA